jgi:transcriptional regulator with XRE-family HTH domain
MRKEREISARIGRSLRARRLALNLSQSQLSELTGVSVKHISRIEAGARGTVTDCYVSTLTALASALECQAGELIDGTDEPLWKRATTHSNRAALVRQIKQLSDHQLDLMLRLAIELSKRPNKEKSQ